MDWATFGALIAKLGLDAAERIFQNWQNKQAVTQADIDGLRVLGRQTPEDLILKGATAIGVASDDPRVLALLNLARDPAAPPPPTVAP